MRLTAISPFAGMLPLALCFVPILPIPTVHAQQSSLNAKAVDDDAKLPGPPDYKIDLAPYSIQGPQFPPRPTRKDERMSKAEEAFEQGRRLYAAGQIDAARAQFDQALDQVLNSRSEPVDRSRFDKRFEELVQKIYRLDVDGLGAGEREQEPGFDKAPIDEIISLTFPVDPKQKHMVHEEVAATVSQLPLEATDAVLSFVNYFSGERGKRTLLAGLRRAGRYKQMISRILDEEGIPQEFIFLAQAESGFLPRAISYKAAGGMWQFIRSRGAEYGLRQNAFMDERFDPELATRAAARHLRDLFHRYGDWYLAIAAYNCGPGNVDRAVEKTGYADVWELRSRRVLPLETSNYVPIILAMTIMSKNPDNYALTDIITDEALEYDTVTMTSMTSLPLISDLTGQPVAELRELNPALLKDVAPPGYRLHVQKGALASLVSGLELIPDAKRAHWRAHRVETGEDIDAIAKRFRVQTAALASANANLAGELQPGSLLVVPSVPVIAKKQPVKSRGAASRAAVAKKKARSKAAASASAKSSSTGKASSSRAKSTNGKPPSAVVAKNRSNRG